MLYKSWYNINDLVVLPMDLLLFSMALKNCLFIYGLLILVSKRIQYYVLNCFCKFFGLIVCLYMVIHNIILNLLEILFYIIW